MRLMSLKNNGRIPFKMENAHNSKVIKGFLSGYMIQIFGFCLELEEIIGNYPFI